MVYFIANDMLIAQNIVVYANSMGFKAEIITDDNTIRVFVQRGLDRLKLAA